MTSLKLILGKNLKRQRELKGLTQASLAERAGVSQNLIAYVESGQRWPSDTNLARLAANLDITASRLLLETTEEELVREKQALLEYRQAILANLAELSRAFGIEETET